MVSGSSASSSGAPVDLRPLTTSELIDRGFSLYRANFAGFLLLALLCQIMPLAASSPMISTIKLSPSEGFLMERPDFLHAALMVAVSVAEQIVTFGFEVVITLYIAQAYLGGVPSIKASMGRTMKSLGGIVWTSLLSMVLIGATLIFPSLAGVAVLAFWVFNQPDTFTTLLLYIGGAAVLITGSLVPVIIVFMRLWVLVPAVAIERLSGWQAVKRSSQIVRYDPGLGILYWGEMRLSFLLLPLCAIEVLVFSLTSLPVLVQHTNEFLRHGGGQIAPPSDSIIILSQILTFLAVSLLLPLYSIAITLFYYDVRIRREGFDLEVMAGRMETAK